MDLLHSQRQNSPIWDQELNTIPDNGPHLTADPDVAPSHATQVALRWNDSKTTMWRLSATFWCVLVMGANDALYGALMPYLQVYYKKTYTAISLVFLSPFFGYCLSAVLNGMVHQHLGRRGVAVIGAGCHIIAFTIISIHPPFPVLIVVFILVGFGGGIQNAAWNTWIGNMANASEVLGFLHGFFGLGATISPLIATSLITKAGWPWYSVYYLMSGAAAIEFIYAVSAFWTSTGLVYQQENPNQTQGSSLAQTKHSLTYKVTWICAIFLFLYGGIEVAIGGWIVVFMKNIRHGSAFASGMTETGFWLGVTVGRFALGFVSSRIGEKISVPLYLLFSIGLELIFWLVPAFIASAVAVSFIGFFMGTIFPSVVVAATRLLPKHIHVASIGFAAAFSMGGGSLFPFIIGAIAQAKGVKVLQPILLAMLAVALGIWLALPSIPRPKHSSEA